MEIVKVAVSLVLSIKQLREAGSILTQHSSHSGRKQTSRDKHMGEVLDTNLAIPEMEVRLLLESRGHLYSELFHITLLNSDKT
jgi:hypothetical protein